jgi:predicted GNAT family acetyltransferase
MPPNAHVLDNLGWHALTSHHARFASGTQLAKRYPADIIALAALADHSEAALRDLAQIVPQDEQIALLEANLPSSIPGWTIHETFAANQMVCQQPLPPIEPTVKIVNLGASDVADMLQLVELTRPGPFSARLMELGNYIGIRQDDQLIAMAGQRIHLTGYQEISTVCTHPEHQGKGYARLLVNWLVNSIWGRGEIPFLHVLPTNTRAIELYEKLHFHERCSIQGVFISR